MNSLQAGADITYLGVYIFEHGAWHTFCKHLFNWDAANRPLEKVLIYQEIQFKILNLTELNLSVSFSPQHSFLLSSDMEMQSLFSQVFYLIGCTGVNSVLFSLLFIWLITTFRNGGPVTKCHSSKREVSLLLVYNSVALLGPTGILINKPNLNYFCKSDFRRPEDPEQRPGHNLKAVKPDILSCYLNQHSNV